MKFTILFFLITLFLLPGCGHQKNTEVSDFWYGPHPEEDDVKFVIHFYSDNDSVSTHGYWLVNNHYNADFEVIRPIYSSSSLSFAIPSWGCEYTGESVSEEKASGYFICEGENSDSVLLFKDNDLGDYLVYPQPLCKDPDFQYTSDASFVYSGDSLFIHNLINEILRGEYGRYNSFLVAKNNQLICEEYFYGYQSEDLHPLESTTKSITSLLVGIAVDQGKIRDVHSRLGDLLPGYPNLKSGKYKDLTLYHLLTMTSGFKMNEPERLRSDDRIKYALNRELLYSPGDTFQYDGGSTEILAAVVKEATGMHADEFAREYLFKPLGIEKYDWEMFRQNGYPLTSGSLELIPGDMIKIGMMVLNNGMWDGKQVISSAWINESTAAHTKTHIEGDNYGYQWWSVSIESGEKSFDVIWANGLGSQFIFIIPELDMVIVTTGYNYEGERSWDIFEGLRKHLYLVEG